MHFLAPNLKMSSGRSFIERLKRRQSQGSKEILRKHSNNKEAKMLDDLVESFDIDYQQSDEEDLNESDRLRGWIPKDRTPGCVSKLYLIVGRFRVR